MATNKLTITILKVIRLRQLLWKSKSQNHSSIPLTTQRIFRLFQFCVWILDRTLLVFSQLLEWELPRLASSSSPQVIKDMRHLIVGMIEPSPSWFGLCNMRMSLFALVVDRKKTHHSFGSCFDLYVWDCFTRATGSRWLVYRGGQKIPHLH